jgi:hypothetical protein
MQSRWIRRWKRRSRELECAVSGEREAKHQPAIAGIRSAVQFYDAAGWLREFRQSGEAMAKLVRLITNE